MTFGLHLLRFALVLVLAAGPLMSSALAAEDGVWSSFWANPFEGTVQVAEEEEPIHEHDPGDDAEEAILWSLTPAAIATAGHRYQAWPGALPAPPLIGALTPPPEPASSGALS